MKLTVRDESATLTPEMIDKQIARELLQVRSVPNGKKLKCIIHYVGGPEHDSEHEEVVDRPYIEIARVNPDMGVSAFQYGRYALVPVVVEGDTPVFAAVWEGWR